MIRQSFIILGIMLVLLSCNGIATLPPVAVNFNKLQQGKYQNYNTYTIFFSPRKVELSKLEIEKQKLLRKSFVNFAKSIGKNNAATWVASNNTYSVKASKNICDLYNLSYTGGPYIVFSNNNPILADKIDKDDVILDFSSVNVNRIKFVLDKLEENIRRKNFIKIDRYEMNKQIVLSLYDNNVKFVQDVIIAILGK
jgi:hypothetical protein